MIEIANAPGAVWLSIALGDQVMVSEMSPQRALELSEGLRRLALAAVTLEHDAKIPLIGRETVQRDLSV